jgi:MoaA/NifB/PqqE/SkfB family radical SAM enzyme
MVRGYQRAHNLFKYGDPFFFRDVNIETSTHCNRRCYYCPQSLDPHKPQFIGDEIFDIILSRLADINWTGPIGYAHFNEPLLNPRLVALVRRTKAALPKSKPRIYTNGDNLTPKLRDDLIAAGVVNFAVTRHDLYERNWNENLLPLVNGLEKYFTLEVIHGRQLSNRGGLISSSKIKVQPMKRCTTPEAAMHISIKGDVLLCCADYYSKYKFGNLTKYSIKTCWRNSRWYRKALREGKPILNICKGCFTS